MSTAELLAKQEYKYGFVTDIESDVIPRGLTEDTIRLIVQKKNEPEWMLEFRLKAFRHWLTMTEPKHWPNIKYPEIDYQDIFVRAVRKASAKGVVVPASLVLLIKQIIYFERYAKLVAPDYEILADTYLIDCMLDDRGAS